MKETWTLIKREYVQAVFKKSFIIMTILMPVLMIGLSIVPTLLLMLDTEESARIHVIDASGNLFPKLSQALNDTLKDGTRRFLIERVGSSPTSIDAIEIQKTLVAEEAITGFIYIPEDIFTNNQFQYYAKNVANFDINQRLKESIEKIVKEQRIEESGLDPQLINTLTRSMQLRTIKIEKSGLERERGFGQEYFSTFIFVMVLYITLILYGTAIMRSIVQEKTSRIVEVMLSATSPFRMMCGKIFGQGFVGLTQYLIWAVFGIALVVFGGQIMPVSREYLNFEPIIFVYFVIFYILGYFIYSILYAAVGALTNSDQEAQQLSTPVILMLIVPIMLIGFLVKNPDSTVAVVLSLIPFFTPIIMFARINLSAPPLWEIWGAILLTMLTILFLIWLVARIYRVGILMYGKRPTLPEIVRWMKQK